MCAELPTLPPVTVAPEPPEPPTPPPVQARDRVAALDLQMCHLRTRRIEQLLAAGVPLAEIEGARTTATGSYAMRPPKPTPKPAPVQAWAILNGQAPTPEERQSAERWMTQRLPRAADDHARAVLAGTATSAGTVRALAPRPKPGCYIDKGATPRDGENDGPLRSQTGADEAARVLDRALDDIAQATPLPAERWWHLAPDPQQWRLEQWAEQADAVVQRMMTAALCYEIVKLRTWRREDAERRAKATARAEEAKQRREAMRRDSPPRRRRNEGVEGF